MTPYYDQDGITIYVGDNRDVLPHLENISAVVTDPPYGLSFMGKDWDHSVPGEAFWRIIADAMKPGAHLLSFGGSRTFHRIGVAIEDAGLELRDTLMWLYGQGFPKSLDVSKAIDKAAGAEREVVGAYDSRSRYDGLNRQSSGIRVKTYQEQAYGGVSETAPATPEAEQWQGWGTALKPSFEPVILARKRLSGTVAANVLAHGTGALNIDASRIVVSPNDPNRRDNPSVDHSADHATWNLHKTQRNPTLQSGRWPANVILDEESAMLLDAQSGVSVSRRSKRGDLADHRGDNYNAANGRRIAGSDYERGHDDTGGASRFFYCAKASRAERRRGLPDDMDANHPTVKPLALMRYLITLITPPGGIVLDPFAGSGSTLVACAELGIPAIGIELSEEYAEIAARRVRHAQQQTKQAVLV